MSEEKIKIVKTKMNNNQNRISDQLKKMDKLPSHTLISFCNDQKNRSVCFYYIFRSIFYNVALYLYMIL
ncbi:hypothetical protein ACG9XR_23950, partial [Acinetobacter guillouiae]|uniref:hypothetical protein n=1 Tax=Acinetobacter guillouiae TaxID=106649 RepID=UPI003AF87AAC